MESSLMTCRDNILQLLHHLSTHIIERKLKIFKMDPISEEIAHFYSIFSIFSGHLLPLYLEETTIGGVLNHMLNNKKSNGFALAAS